MKASRQFEIIRFAQKDLDIKDMSSPMNAEEKRFYDHIKKEVERWRAEGIEPMFDIPNSYDDEEDAVGNVYSDDFDDKVLSKLK